MATNVSFGQFVDPAEQDIQRRMALAQALQQQSSTPIEQQTAGGRAVKISPFQGLAKIAQALAAGKMNTDAMGEQKALVDQKRAQGASDIEGIVAALRGTPARTIQPNTPNDDDGNPNAPVQMDAQAPDTAKAFALALKSENPMAQGIGSSLLSTMMPKVAKWEKVDKPNGDGSTQTGFVDVNSPDPWKTFQSGGTAPVKGIVNNGSIVSPYAVGTSTPKQADAPNPGTNLVIPGANGQMVPNQPLIDARKAIAKSGASNISFSTEKGYAGELAKGLAKQDLEALDAARSAPQRVQAAQQVKKILDTQTPITGTGAEARLAVNKALATAGVIDGQAVKSTEDLASLLANQTLEAIKTSGLGAGQGFTDKDRQFLERAKSGNIEINSGTLRTLAELNEKSARTTIDQGAKVAKRIRGNKDFGTVGQDIDFAQPPAYTPQSLVKQPTAQPGKPLVYDPTSGTFK